MSKGDCHSSAGSESGPRRCARRWREADKRRIVAESSEPGVTAAAVAKRNDLNANLLFDWGRKLRRQDRETRAFVPVVVAPPSEVLVKEGDCGVSTLYGRMEIALSARSRVTVDRVLDAAALSRVLGVLERR